MKKISLIMITFILALGLTGAGYAMWSDSIDIDAGLTIGNVEAVFWQAVTNDPSAEGADPRVKGEWTAWTLGAELDGSAWTGGGTSSNEKAAYTTVSGQGTDTLTIIMDKAYVGYYGSVGCTIMNTGSVPIKVENVTAVITPPTTGAVSDVEVTFSGALDTTNLTVIDPGEEVLGGVYFNWTSTPIEAASYGLSVTVNVCQFNE